MLEDAAGIRRVVLACGTVDLRKGIDGLATIIGDKYGQNPFEKGTLFLFCGKRSDRCKVSAKYCYAAHESRLHQNDRCKRFALCLVLTVRFRSLAPWGKLFQLFI